MAHDYEYGTAYFVSKSHALLYYKEYIGAFDNKKEQRIALRSFVNEKIADGEIFIGPPPESYGEITGVNSEGRYMVRSLARGR